MNKMLVVGGLFLALLVPSAFAGSQRTQATVVLCVELHGNPETRFDVKRRRGSKCPRGEDKVTLPRGLRPAWSSRSGGTAGRSRSGRCERRHGCSWACGCDRLSGAEG